MLTGTKYTFHTHPSLLPLQRALSAAENIAPCRPPQTDANEQLAMQLIARMQAQYKKEFPFLSVQDIPDTHGLHIPIHGMVEVHAG